MLTVGDLHTAVSNLCDRWPYELDKRLHVYACVVGANNNRLWLILARTVGAYTRQLVIWSSQVDCKVVEHGHVCECTKLQVVGYLHWAVDFLLRTAGGNLRTTSGNHPTAGPPLPHKTSSTLAFEERSGTGGYICCRQLAICSCMVA